MDIHTINIQEVADYVIWKCKQQHWSLTLTHLQYILYYIQAYSLYEGSDNKVARQANWPKGVPIFADRPEVDGRGVVYRSLYHIYKSHNRSDLTTYLKTIKQPNARRLRLKHRLLIKIILKACYKTHKLQVADLRKMSRRELAWQSADQQRRQFRAGHQAIKLRHLKAHKPQLVAEKSSFLINLATVAETIWTIVTELN